MIIMDGIKTEEFFIAIAMGFLGYESLHSTSRQILEYVKVLLSKGPPR